MSGLVHATITGEVVGHPIAAPVKFVYDPADPYAVVVDFTGLTTEPEQLGETIMWTFARSLLAAALTSGHAGHGDVALTAHRPWLTIALSSPDGTGRFRFPTRPVHRWLVATERAVPIGDEARHQAAALDAAVERLLGRGVR